MFLTSSNQISYLKIWNIGRQTNRSLCILKVTNHWYQTYGDVSHLPRLISSHGWIWKLSWKIWNFEATPLGLPYRPWMGLKSGRYYQQDVLLYKNSNPATESHGCSPQGCTVRPRKGAGQCSMGGGCETPALGVVPSQQLPIYSGLNTRVYISFKRSTCVNSAGVILYSYSLIILTSQPRTGLNGTKIPLLFPCTAVF
jgi:hypothetical protein